MQRNSRFFKHRSRLNIQDNKIDYVGGRDECTSEVCSVRDCSGRRSRRIYRLSHRGLDLGSLHSSHRADKATARRTIFREHRQYYNYEEKTQSPGSESFAFVILLN